MSGKGDPLGIVQESEIYHTTKLYMHKPDYVPENKTHKILWDSEIQTDNLIPIRRPHLVIINNKRKGKENMQKRGLCCPGILQSENQRKQKQGQVR